MKTIARTLLGLTAGAALGAGAAAQSLIYNLPGELAGDRFGHAVRIAGDVDGDGVADLVASAPFGASGRGYVQVVSGASGAAVRTWTGAVPGIQFGAAVDGLGDLDGDGRAEVIAGAPLAGPGGAGTASVYSGLDGSLLHALSGDGPGDHFGFAVAGLGDVDGDGVGDFAVGALDDDDRGPSSGSVRVFSGAGGGELYTLYGASAGELFGYAIAGLGDVDGDGRADFAVGAPRATAVLPGWAGVYSGASGALLFSWTGAAAGDAFGRAVAGAGDLDGDGTGDVLVGAPHPSGGAAGYARAFCGASGALLWEAAGSQAGSLFGAALSPAGDVDLDGLPDVAIGAPREDGAGLDSGSVRMVSGRSGLELATLRGAVARAELGGSLGGACDVNADGVADLALGSAGDPAQGPAAGSARMVSVRSVALRGDVHLISLSAGGAQILSADAGPAAAGLRYLVIGSASGMSPGRNLGGVQVHLNLDRYMRYTLEAPPAGALSPASGWLDHQGRAAIAFAPPPPSPAYLVGRTFHHVLVAFGAAGRPVLATNPVAVTILP